MHPNNVGKQFDGVAALNEFAKKQADPEHNPQLKYNVPWTEKSGSQTSHYYRWMHHGEYDEAQKAGAFKHHAYVSIGTPDHTYSNGIEQPHVLVKFSHVDNTFEDEGRGKNAAWIKGQYPFSSAQAISASHPDVAKKIGVPYQRGAWDLENDMLEKRKNERGY
jgi:hypothetical protein